MNETARQTVYRTLEELGISYTIAEHAPMHTVEDMMNATLGTQGTIAKNLFLRDAKGRRHFLIVIRWDKNVDIKTLRTVIGSTALSFGSEERLMTHLGIRPGSVSPFCILNNTEKNVEVFFDRDLAACPLVGVHPNDNTATVFLTFADLERTVRHHGNPATLISIPEA